jgi:hypothetical protein
MSQPDPPASDLGAIRAELHQSCWLWCATCGVMGPCDMGLVFAALATPPGEEA